MAMINVKIEKINNVDNDIKKITNFIKLKKAITTDLNLDEVKNRIEFSTKNEVCNFIENINDFEENN